MTYIFIGLIFVSAVGAVVVNIDGSNLTPLSWFNSNKTIWDAKGNASYPVNVNNNTQVINFGAAVNSTMDRNASNMTYTLPLPNSSIPLSALNETIISFARVYNSSNSIPLQNLVFTKLILNTKSFDTLNNFNTTTSNFTAPKTGYYRIHYTVLYLNTVSNTIYLVTIYKNGVSYSSFKSYSNANGQQIEVGNYDVVPLNVGDTIEIYVYSSSGDNNVIIYSSTGDGTYISFEYIRSL